jgi:hypothetical protein
MDLPDYRQSEQPRLPNIIKTSVDKQATGKDALPGKPSKSRIIKGAHPA